MKKLILFVVLMGVLVLQSCTSYRIKVTHHDKGVTYYFPQKRSFETLFEWRDVYNREGSYTLEWARKEIEADRYKQTKGIEYIKVK